MDPILVMAYVFGFISIILFCIQYFNEPAYTVVGKQDSVPGLDHLLEPVSPRLLTNRYRYQFYLFIFIFMTLLLYLILTQILHKLPGMPEKGSVYNAFISAFILTGFAPNLPMIRRYLDSLKTILHQKAQIPEEGQGLYHHIKRHRIEYNDQLTSATMEDPIYGLGLEASYFLPGSENKNIAGRWAWVAYIQCKISQWSQQPGCRFSGGLLKKRWIALQKDFQDLQEKLLQEKGRKLNRSEYQEMRKQMELHCLQTRILLVGVLLCRKSRSASVNDSLRELGYPPYLADIFIPSPQKFAFFLIGLFFSILLGAILVDPLSKLTGHPIPGPAFEIIPLWLVYGILIHSGAVFSVLGLKWYLTTAGSSIWPVVTFKNFYQTLSDRPWHIYLLCALLSYCAGILILSGLLVARPHYVFGDLTSGKLFGTAWPWALICIVTGAFLSFRIDSLPTGKSFSRRLSSLFWAAVQGLTTMGVVWTAFHLHITGNYQLPPGQALISREMLPACMISGFVTGFSIYLFSRFSSKKMEQRKYKRVKMVPIKFEAAASAQEGAAELIDLSRKGARLRSDLKVFYGNLISLKYGTDFSASGQVVRSADGEIAVQFTDNGFWKAFRRQTLVPVSG